MSRYFKWKINAPEDVRYKFKFIDLKSDKFNLPWIRFKDIVFNNNTYPKITKDIITSFSHNITDEEEEIIANNVAQIVKIFQTDENIIYQEIDSIDNPERYNEDDVVEIFIRANSGGTPLSKSDLLFSLLASSWEDSDEKMEVLLEELNKTGYKFNRDFILKTCLTILNKGAAYNVNKFRDETTKNNIIDNWDKISDAIKDVKDYLYGKTFIKSDKALPSYLGLIPLIYFRYHFKNKWNDSKK